MCKEKKRLNVSFDAFWQAYPRKVAKLAALKAWDKAIKISTAEEIIEGVERYKKNKPGYCDWCHPATFLNQGRWMDEYEESGIDWSKYKRPTPEEAEAYVERYPFYQKCPEVIPKDFTVDNVVKLRREA